MQDLAKSILNIEQQIQELTAQLTQQKAALVAQMAEEKVKQVVVPGAGYISYVSESVRTSLDSKAARELLEKHNFEVPLTISPVKATIRVYKNV